MISTGGGKKVVIGKGESKKSMSRSTRERFAIMESLSLMGIKD